MNRRYLALDIEIAKILPDSVDDLKAHRPLGITCAAMRAEDEDEPHLWYSCNADGSPAPQMNRNDLGELVSYLTEQVADGYTIVTWNGVGFDFDILGEESGRLQECRALAMSHVDMMFVMHCVKGFVVSLNAASVGIGGRGKPLDISGAMAPRLWATGESQKVLAYAANDCLITLQVAKVSEQRERFSWVTRRGAQSDFRLPSGRWLTVAEAIRLPRPDTSWMTEPPWPRERFTSWLGNHSAISVSENEIVDAKVIAEPTSATKKPAKLNEFIFDISLFDSPSDQTPSVGDPVSFWAPPDRPEAIFIYQRGSVGGSGKLGVVPAQFVSRIAHHRASGLPIDTEILRASVSSCSIRCSLISAEEVEAARAEDRKRLLAELAKPYRPRKPVAFSVDAKSIVLTAGQVLIFESIPTVAECAANLYGSQIVIRLEDGRTILKDDEPTVIKKLVRLSHTFDSIEATVTGRGHDKHWYESEFKVQVAIS